MLETELKKLRSAIDRLTDVLEAGVSIGNITSEVLDTPPATPAATPESTTTVTREDPPQPGPVVRQPEAFQPAIQNDVELKQTILQKIAEAAPLMPEGSGTVSKYLMSNYNTTKLSEIDPLQYPTILNWVSGGWQGQENFS